jgi:hypothetical protein
MNVSSIGESMSATFEMVRQMALSLDNVEECTSYGTPAFKVKGKLFARLHQDGESLVVRMGFDQREDLMAIDPDTYYITDHYANYEWLLVRLSRVQADPLRELIAIAWSSRIPRKKNASSSRKS